MGEKSIMHYSNSHKILLVGEGDFSFSLSIAKAFGTAINMVATSLDSRVSLWQKYSHALSNVTALEVLGCTIFHEMDVHTMNDDPRLKHKKFDRIIYNFPHVGFICAENTVYQIQLNRILVSGFFANAKHMLSINGEIHITHKTTHPFTHWDIKELASREDLDFVEEVIFRKRFYPGYYNKRGSGSRCNQNFPIGKSSTFKFKARKEARVNYEQEEYLRKWLNTTRKTCFSHEHLPRSLNPSLLRHGVATDPSPSVLCHGSGSKSNQNFPIRKSSTFKFMAPKEDRVNYEQEEYEEEYLRKGLNTTRKTCFSHEHLPRSLNPSLLCHGVATDPSPSVLCHGSGSRSNQNFPIRKSSTFKFMAPKEDRVNYEQEESEESEEEYLRKQIAKQNRVRPKWLRGLLQLGSWFCGFVLCYGCNGTLE